MEIVIFSTKDHVPVIRKIRSPDSFRMCVGIPVYLCMYVY